MSALGAMSDFGTARGRNRRLGLLLAAAALLYIAAIIAFIVVY